MDPTDPIHKRLAEYIESEIMSCTFVGISGEKEVFLTFDHENETLEASAKKKIQNHFGEEITSLTTIISVSIEEVTKMVDQLNQVLEETQDVQKPDLLKIGSF